MSLRHLVRAIGLKTFTTFRTVMIHTHTQTRTQTCTHTHTRPSSKLSERERAVQGVTTGRRGDNDGCFYLCCQRPNVLIAFRTFLLYLQC